MIFSRTGSETQVRDETERLMTKSLKSGNRLIVVEVRSIDIDRISTYTELARKLDLEFHLTARLAYLLHQVEASQLDRRLTRRLPKLKEVNVQVKKKTRYDWWETLLIVDGHEPTRETELFNLQRPLLLLDSATLDPFETHLPKGKLYIQNVSDHVDEEGVYEEERLH